MLPTATLRYCIAIMFKNRRCFQKIKSGLLGKEEKALN